MNNNKMNQSYCHYILSAAKIRILSCWRKTCVGILKNGEIRVQSIQEESHLVKIIYVYRTARGFDFKISIEKKSLVNITKYIDISSRQKS